MTDRELFEQWFCRKFSVDILARVTRLHINGRGLYSNRGVQVRWETWQEARALMAEAA